MVCRPLNPSLLAAFVCASIFAFVPIHRAHAQGQEDASADSGAPLANSLRGAALEAYRAAHIAYGDGDYAGARLKFETAYEVSGNPRLLWNMAACEKAQRDYAEVTRLVTRYLEEMGEALTPDRRTRAKALLEAVSAYVAKLEVEVSQDEATLTIDGEKVGVSPLAQPLLVTHGERELRVSKQGYREFRQQLELPGGDRMRLFVNLIEQPEEGVLVVDAGGDGTIHIDGEPVGVGHFRGTLASGQHVVSIRADGKRPYESTVEIRTGETDTLRVRLSSSSEQSETQRRRRVWGWVATGVALAAGAGVATYYAVRDEAGPIEQPGGLDTARLLF